MARTGRREVADCELYIDPQLLYSVWGTSMPQTKQRS